MRPLIEHEFSVRRQAEQAAQTRERLRQGLAIRVDQGRLDRLATNLPPAKTTVPGPLPKG